MHANALCVNCQPMLITTFTTSTTMTLYNDLQYLPTNNPKQTLDLYLCNKQTDNTPLLAYIHGGLWADNDKSVYKHIGHLFSNDEYNCNVAIINYRLTKTDANTVWPTFQHDVYNALVYLQQHSKQHNYIFNHNVILIGHSCGASMSMITIINDIFIPTDNVVYRTQVYIDMIQHIVGVIGIQGIYDYVQYVNDHNEWADAITTPLSHNQSIWPKPIDYVKQLINQNNNDTSLLCSKQCKILLLHSTQDQWVETTQCQSMHNALKQLNNNNVAQYIAEFGDHHGVVNDMHDNSTVTQQIYKFVQSIIANQCNIQYFLIDAFTTNVGHGNAATVIILPYNYSMSDDTMKQLATEFNTPACAFIKSLNNDNNNNNNVYDIRWFSSSGEELLLCGHATLSSSHVLYKHNIVSTNQTIQFNNHIAGKLYANYNNSDNIVELIFPAKPSIGIVNIQQFDNNILQALQLNTSDIICISEHGLDCIIEVKHTDTVKSINNVDFVSLLQYNTKYRGFLITSYNTNNSKYNNIQYNFVSRCFFNLVKEDPVTGSAHCALACYYSDKYNLHNKQLIGYQGSNRGGIVYCKYNSSDNTVTLGGQAVTVVQGQLDV